MRYLVPVLALSLMGCEVKVSVDSKPSPTNNGAPIVPVAAPAPTPTADTVKVEEGTPSGEVLGVVNPENTGYFFELINGYLKLEGERFFFSPQVNGSWGPQTTVLTLKGNIIAYRVSRIDMSDRSIIRLFYFDANKKGWYRDMVGVNNGVPFFGKAEEQ